jgi:hypothetical protein
MMLSLVRPARKETTPHTTVRIRSVTLPKTAKLAAREIAVSALAKARAKAAVETLGASSPGAQALAVDVRTTVLAEANTTGARMEKPPLRALRALRPLPRVPLLLRLPSLSRRRWRSPPCRLKSTRSSKLRSRRSTSTSAVNV